MTIYKRTF